MHSLSLMSLKASGRKSSGAAAMSALPHAPRPPDEAPAARSGPRPGAAQGSAPDGAAARGRGAGAGRRRGARGAWGHHAASNSNLPLRSSSSKMAMGLL
jgi:hypothetical protein